MEQADIGIVSIKLKHNELLYKSLMNNEVNNLIKPYWLCLGGAFYHFQNLVVDK